MPHDSPQKPSSRRSSDGLCKISDPYFRELTFHALTGYAVVLDLGLIGCLVHYRGCRGPLLVLTEPRETKGGPTAL